MKALIIADNDMLIDLCCDTLEKAGYELIIYRWLLKALDNIEEIAPDIIVIDVSSYPRHWKTLVQYASSVTSDSIDFFLFSSAPLSEVEQKKASFLNVKKIFNDSDILGFKSFFSPKSFTSKLRREKNLDNSFDSTIECMFELKEKGIVTGKVISFTKHGKKKILTFAPDNTNMLIDIAQKHIDNLIIKQLSNDSICSATATIISSNSTSLTMEISI